jgi:hypothetical protein
MKTRLKLTTTLLCLAVAGCAGQPTTSAAAGGTLAVDATPVRTFSGAAVTAGPGSVTVTGRDWNCPRCYK